MTAQTRRFNYCIVPKINQLAKQMGKIAAAHAYRPPKEVRIIKTDDVPLDVYLRRKHN